MLRKFFAAIAAFVMAFIMVPGASAQLPDQGISTTSPVFNDMNGRVAKIHLTFTDPSDGIKYGISCTATSLGNSLWLSSAHCFDGKDMSAQEKRELKEGAYVVIGKLGTPSARATTIETIEFAPDSQNYVQSGNDWVPKNDLVLLKTKDDIANGGFDVWIGGTTPPPGSTVTATGSGGKDFVTTVTFPSNTTYTKASLNNEIIVNHYSRVGTCGGDSGGAIVLDGKDLIGINAAGNGRNVNPSCDEATPRNNYSFYVPLATDANKNFLRSMKDKYAPSAPMPVSGGSGLSS